MVRNERTGRAKTVSYVPADHPIHQFRYDARRAAQEAMVGYEPVQDLPVVLQAKFFLPRPAWCDAMIGRGKERRPKYSTGAFYCAHRPDLKNLLWGLEDALRGVCWKDDDQVVGFGDSGKLYHESGGEPGVEVEIWTVDMIPSEECEEES